MSLTPETIQAAAKLIGLSFTRQEMELMVAGLEDLRKSYESLHQAKLENHVAPALHFRPLPASAPAPHARAAAPAPPSPAPAPPFASISQQAQWLRQGRITSVALTERYLHRLQRCDPHLHCVITLTEERALAAAAQADAELAAGKDRGPLHGIPWGAKDLLAVRGYPTTWGAAPYQAQMLDQDAAVVQRLDAAGAVLVAKLSMGALAWGDVWFGGQTRTPWNVQVGASGSSAGPGAATAAGLVSFSIGTETYGSIVSPSNRNGVTGLRPSFGRVNRDGAMALSWSMDKIGPMCRSAQDCALVFAAIHQQKQPFVWPVNINFGKLRLGYLADDFAGDYREQANDARALQIFREMGAQLIPLHLPAAPIDALKLILFAEAAAAFDNLTRSGQDDELVRQSEDAWPNFFRVARLIPAVAYIQANRVRAQLMEAMHALMQSVDACLVPSLAGDALLLTNLTGHPSLTLPTGFADDQLPTSISLIGRMNDESTLLALGQHFQQLTTHHKKPPPLCAP